jgi:uncharacterized phage protein (TIGR02220 family)
MLCICGGNYDKKVFEKFKQDENGLYFNERMDEEIKKRQAYSESRANNRRKETHEKDMKNISKTYVQHMGNGNENINENINININELVNRVIEYLNLKCKTRYKANTNDVKKHLIARINEGYTYEDFVKVIAIKCAEWKGTEFEKYLRPATLFGIKFQSYLNQPVKETSYGDADSFFESACKRTYEDDEDY